MLTRPLRRDATRWAVALPPILLLSLLAIHGIRSQMRRESESIRKRTKWLGWGDSEAPSMPPMTPPTKPPPAPCTWSSPTCCFVDVFQNCYKPYHSKLVPYAKALQDPNGWKLKDVALGSDCKANWALNSAATATAVLVRDAINYLEMPIHLSHFLPEDSQLEAPVPHGSTRRESPASTLLQLTHLRCRW